MPPEPMHENTADRFPGLQIAPTLSMSQRKDTMELLNERSSRYRRFEWALAALALVALISIAAEIFKRHF